MTDEIQSLERRARVASFRWVEACGKHRDAVANKLDATVIAELKRESNALASVLCNARHSLDSAKSDEAIKMNEPEYAELEAIRAAWLKFQSMDTDDRDGGAREFSNILTATAYAEWKALANARLDRIRSRRDRGNLQ